MNLADKLSDNLVETDSGCWEFVGGRTGSGLSLKEIGRLYNVTGEAIGLIKSGKNWGWLK